MSRRFVEPMHPEVVAAQRAASDPAHSVWVTANAGSGKTYVLTARVLRLLLSGVRPEEIICLTYTKAAAAEMRARVGARLGRWTLIDDAALDADLTALTGAPPTSAMRLRARTLFAHALETPGGLKIQTIHAFCESVLHRFPKEADVPFGFSVIEDYQRDVLLTEAREAVLAAGLRGSGDAHAVETLFGLMSDFMIETAITEALSKQPVLRKVLARRGEAKQHLRRLLAHTGCIADVHAEIAAGYGLSASDHAALFEVVRPEPGGDDLADVLAQVDPTHPDPELLFLAFLTKTGHTAKKILIKKQTAALIPDVFARMVAEADRLERLYGKLVAAELLERSEALLDIVAAISVHYEAAKKARSLLDFDDLIEKMSALLSDPATGPWVRFKLDTGISHILVDEGQDTNPQQWNVVRELIAEFFYGDSAADRPRTLFVVGDQKQSIFSFQGADPVEFVGLGSEVYFTARSVDVAITRVKLNFSFRTLQNVLDAVDKVFERPDLKEGALEETVIGHRTARADAGGSVTLWPPLREAEDEIDPDNWPTEAPAAQIQSAARRVAERIAREIRGWIDEQRPLGTRGRPVTADDVLILVQVRNVLFHEIIRALIRLGIPTPGADRLAVTTHIGTLDMLALGDVLSNSADDLQLAALLRSPLFDISEADLMAVAQPRPDKTPLWDAMRESGIVSVRAASETLRRWRNQLDFERPFNLYSTILYAEGGLKKMRGRFGSEIDDVMAEFLDLALAHEQSRQPSLTGFLAELRSREVIIKRELAEGGAGVRVMTVHGAKGLEAPIVILADAASTEIGRDRRAIYMNPDTPLFFHASSKDTHTPQTMDHKDFADAAQKAEYWRKLYVAMTRAEDELYVTGSLTKKGRLDGSWYEAIEQRLAPESEIVADGDEVSALIYPRERPAPVTAAADGRADARDAVPALPRLPDYKLRRIVRPSRAAEEADPVRVLETTTERLSDPRDPETARKEGIALHALLQHLSRIDPAHWDAVSAKALPVLLPGGRHEHVSRKARALLTKPALAELFRPRSRGEVPVLAQGQRNGNPITIAGRIDRLVVTPDTVLIVDFKSDARQPASAADMPDSYVMQLGLYALCARQLFPGRRIEAAILWTELESLMNLPSEQFEARVAGFTIG